MSWKNWQYLGTFGSWTLTAASVGFALWQKNYWFLAFGLVFSFAYIATIQWFIDKRIQRIITKFTTLNSEFVGLKDSWRFLSNDLEGVRKNWDAVVDRMDGDQWDKLLDRVGNVELILGLSGKTKASGE